MIYPQIYIYIHQHFYHYKSQWSLGDWISPSTLQGLQGRFPLRKIGIAEQIELLTITNYPKHRTKRIIGSKWNRKLSGNWPLIYRVLRGLYLIDFTIQFTWRSWDRVIKMTHHVKSIKTVDSVRYYQCWYYLCMCQTETGTLWDNTALKSQNLMYAA